MAIYTHLTHDDISQFLAGYDVGTLTDFKGITEGVSNTNYFITVIPSEAEGSSLGAPKKDPSTALRYAQDDSTNYILTLFERRFKLEELPYFVALMEWFAARGISCPQPIKMRDGRTLSALKERPALMVSFLEGAGVEPRKITPEHMVQLGQMVARMHIAGMGFPHERKNSLSLPAWEAMIDELDGHADEISEGLTKLISEEYNYLSEHWPNDLPAGAIHADLFPDNVFFSSTSSSHLMRGSINNKMDARVKPEHDKKLTGVIDFYFACNDFWAYDLAIVVNAWCFDGRHRFQKDRVAALMQGYNDIRPLNPEEEMSFPLLLRGAALRFLLTRSLDALNPPEGAEITPKDPHEYIAKLSYFRDVR